jgi:hypothetical protein
MQLKPRRKNVVSYVAIAICCLCRHSDKGDRFRVLTIGWTVETIRLHSIGDTFNSMSKSFLWLHA